jgi:hypothetical protein
MTRWDFQVTLHFTAFHLPQVANKPPADSSMTAVANQPVIFKRRERVNCPITAEFVAMSMMTTITGPAKTPLITAAQNSALIGSIGVKFGVAESRYELGGNRNFPKLEIMD